MTRYKLLTERANVVSGPTAEDIPQAPPQYTPATELHAGTASLDDYPSAPTSSSPSLGEPDSFGSPAHHPHGPNLAVIVGAVLVGSVMLGIIVATSHLFIKRNAKKLNARRPKFTMLRPSSLTLKNEKDDTMSVSSSFGNFVFITTSEGEVMTLEKDRKDQSMSPPADDAKYGEMQDLSDYFSPEAPRTSTSDAPRDWLGMAGLTSSISAPASPSLSNRDFSLHLQRQKAAELAQIVRMKFVREELPSARTCPEGLSGSSGTRRQSMAHGLDIVHEESEVDIATTALCALDRYSVSFDPSSPTVPISKLFRVDEDGKVVRLASPATSPLTPLSDVMPTTPLSAQLSDTGSLTEEGEDDVEDLKEAVIVRLGQTRSVEIKRGVLVSLRSGTSITTSPPLSRSTSILADHGSHFATRPNSMNALAAPPTLSPIVTSSTSLSAEIEETLEERVFAYRQSGPWSKENYKLTTPGQVRALTEALEFAKPHAVQHQEQAWPWPAHRCAFEDGDDE